MIHAQIDAEISCLKEYFGRIDKNVLLKYPLLGGNQEKKHGEDVKCGYYWKKIFFTRPIYFVESQ